MNVLRFWLVQSALFPLVGIALWISTHNDKTEMIETMSDVCAFFKVQNWRQLWIGWRMQMPEWERCLQLQDGVWTPHIYGHIIKGKTSKFWNIKMTTIQSLSTDDIMHGTAKYQWYSFWHRNKIFKKNWKALKELMESFVNWKEKHNTFRTSINKLLIFYWSFFIFYILHLFYILISYWSFT